MANEADIVRLFAECDKAFGPLTGLVNNAATGSPKLQKIEDYQMEEVLRLLQVNTASVLICCRRSGQAHGDAQRRQGRRHRQRVLDRRRDRLARPVHPLRGSKAAVDL